MITVIAISAITAFIYFSIAFRVSKNAVKILSGHSVITDLVFTVGLSVFFASTGSITGALISVMTGLWISLVLIGLNRYTETMRFERKINPLTNKKYLFKWELKKFPAKYELPSYISNTLNKFKRNEVVV